MEKDKQRQQEKIQQLSWTLKERDVTIERYKNTTADSEPSSSDMEKLFIQKPNVATKINPKAELFERFLDLRKKLRRSIFRDDEVSMLFFFIV